MIADRDKVVRGVMFSKPTGMKYLWVGPRFGLPIMLYPLGQDRMDRKIRLLAQARLARIRLTTITPMCLAEMERLGITTDHLKVVCIDETP